MKTQTINLLFPSPPPPSPQEEWEIVQIVIPETWWRTLLGNVRLQSEEIKKENA